MVNDISCADKMADWPVNNTLFHCFITSEFFIFFYTYIWVGYGSGFHFVYSFSLSALTEGLAVGFIIYYRKRNPFEWTSRGNLWLRRIN